MPIDLRRILLVEDSPNDAELTLEALRESGLANDVEWVRDGAEALGYLRAEGRLAGRGGGNPAVVLLDLKLPEVNGLEVLRHVRADGELRTIPIVVLTPSREERDLVASYDLGVNDDVVKPVEFAAFAQAVRHLGMFWAILNEPPPGK